MQNTRRRLLAGLVAMAAPLAAKANDYGSIYFFGDSLTDSGAYANLVGPAVSRFTNNPGTVWAENLGSRYGRDVSPGYALNPLTAQFSATGGNNYAIGGARVAGTPGVFSLPAPNEALGEAIAAGVVPVADQVTAHLGTGGGRAAGDGLYAVWAGANDVFYQAQVIATLGTGAIPQASNDLIAAAVGTATQLVRLRQAGAGQLLVIALPDMGATPYGAADPAATGALLSQLSAGYNQALSQALVTVGLTDIVFLDPRPLLADMQARPAAWGIGNATVPACGAISSLGCGPAQQIPGSGNFLFADGVHPTAFTHRIIADWAFATLEAPGRMAAMTTLAAGDLDGQWRSIDQRLRRLGDRADGWQAYATAEQAPDEADRTGALPGLSGDRRSLTVGADRRWGRLLGGIAAGFVDSGFAFEDRGGALDYRGTFLSAYGALDLDGPYLEGSFSYGRLDFDSHRYLGPLTMAGSTRADHWGLKLGGGVRLAAGPLSHGPVAAFLWNKVEVDGFAESGLTAMAFGPQTRESLRHRLGWQAEWHLPMAWGSLTPYGRLTHEKEYRDRQGSVSAGFVDSPFRYSVPVRSNGDSYGLLALGATFQVGKLAAQVGFTTTLGQPGRQEDSLSLGLSLPF